ncbi:MAG: GNAT family N-acetyltransferase [Caldilineaceae bacterium]|nr:GNAT family N-acetyltransferase [Caldilineaceae bacterium]
MTDSLAEASYVGDLGNGLVRRWSTQAGDAAEVGYLMATVFRDKEDAELRPSEIDAARIFLSGNFPFAGPGDFAVIEDTTRSEHRIVACTCYFRHEWSYAGIRFGVGRPEEVATHPEYRNRGLVRALFEMVHARSAANGDMAQAITGIEYFYRQFGYEYVLDLGGFRTVQLTAIPSLKDGESEPFTLRAATVADVPLLETLYNRRRQNSLVWHEAPTRFWEFLITSWDDPAVAGKDVLHVGLKRRAHIVINDEGTPCGYVLVDSRRWSKSFYVPEIDLTTQVNWQEAIPSVLRALKQIGEATPAMEDAVCSELRLGFGRTHPAYDILGNLAPRYEPPYTWYLRVPDVLGFIQLIKPVLEERIEQSVVAGLTGELKIDFYRGGMRLQFEKGKITTIEPWRTPAFGHHADVACTALIFLQLLFGYRSLAELREIFPDVWAKDSAAVQLAVLFPKQPSKVDSLV